MWLVPLWLWLTDPHNFVQSEQTYENRSCRLLTAWTEFSGGKKLQCWEFWFLLNYRGILEKTVGLYSLTWHWKTILYNMTSYNVYIKVIRKMDETNHKIYFSRIHGMVLFKFVCPSDLLDSWHLHELHSRNMTFRKHWKYWRQDFADMKCNQLFSAVCSDKQLLLPSAGQYVALSKKNNNPIWARY